MKTLITSVTTLLAARSASALELTQPQSTVLSALGRVRRVALGALLLGSVFVAGPVAAQQSVGVDKTDAATFRVRTKNLAEQRVQVQVISCATGKRLFSETYDHSHYTRRLSFQNLQPGTYFLIAKLGQDSYRYTIQVKSAAAGSTVAVRNMTVRLGKQSQEVAALNKLVPAEGAAALAAAGAQ